ncbi:O-acetylhomoserine sulfhydrylase / O-succinylhomoserine sulfhydrylase [hydrothermal vent metagenome]|uniref:O-acetylhomoserine sulfhydrylase / O-succinylhomoserine sulfhydrylase n=1 Tax=hydrothermal vent metagenome TaxID=652676 RepID=A0A3B1E749_9ZZZZ
MSFDPHRALAEVRHEFGEHGGVNMSIEASTTFTVLDAEVMPEIFQGQRGPDQGGCYLYGRHFNPTVYVLGRYLAALEGTEAAYCTASGLSAIAAAIIQLCKPGDHIVSGDTIYGGTHALLKEFLPAKNGIETTFVDISDHEALAGAMRENTKVVFCESLANPTLVVADIPKIAEIAHANGSQLIVDNTFTPMLISPAQLGADVVVHSMTKFLGGASDHIAGAVCASQDFIVSLMDLHMGALMLLGPTMDPMVAAALSLRLPHLGLRMAEHSRRAQAFAERMAERNLNVVYPGLPNHPGHDLFRTLANEGYGFGGIFALDTGSRDKAFELMDELQNVHRFGFQAVSLGYFDTLMSCSASSTSSEMSDEDLEAAGIKPGLVRISIGYTGTLEQRWAQFTEALSQVALL